MMSRITLDLRKAGELTKEDEDDPQCYPLTTIRFRANTGMHRGFAASSTPTFTRSREDPDA